MIEAHPQALGLLPILAYMLAVSAATVFGLWATNVLKFGKPSPDDDLEPDPYQHPSSTIAGVLLFKSAGDRNSEIGRLGELLTRLIFVSRGFRDIPAKFGPDNGIDGLFVKNGAIRALIDRGDSSQITDIYVTESKANGGALAVGTLSDVWIKDRLARANPNVELDVIKPLILKGMEIGFPRIRREHWHHDFGTGKTEVRELDPQGSLLFRNEQLFGAIETVFFHALKTENKFKWLPDDSPILEMPTSLGARITRWFGLNRE